MAKDAISLGDGLSLNDRLAFYQNLVSNDATDQKVIWKTDNANVVKVNSNGEVTPVGVGTATIFAASGDGEKIATCTVTLK